jgi:hypothetical protein
MPSAENPGRQSRQIGKRQVLAHRNALKSRGKNTGLLTGCPFQPAQPPPADTSQIRGPLWPQKAAAGMIRTAFDQGGELSTGSDLHRRHPEQFAAQRQLLGAIAVAEEAEVTDAVKGQTRRKVRSPEKEGDPAPIGLTCRIGERLKARCGLPRGGDYVWPEVAC